MKPTMNYCESTLSIIKNSNDAEIFSAKDISMILSVPKQSVLGALLHLHKQDLITRTAFGRYCKYNPALEKISHKSTETYFNETIKLFKKYNVISADILIDELKITRHDSTNILVRMADNKIISRKSQGQYVYGLKEYTFGNEFSYPVNVKETVKKLPTIQSLVHKFAFLLANKLKFGNYEEDLRLFEKLNPTVQVKPATFAYYMREIIDPIKMELGIIPLQPVKETKYEINYKKHIAMQNDTTLEGLKEKRNMIKNKIKLIDIKIDKANECLELSKKQESMLDELFSGI